MTVFSFPPGTEPEVMLLLDQTGSMTYPTSATNDTARHTTIEPGLKAVISQLAAVDREEGAGQQEAGGGGAYVVGFAGGRAYDHGDINLESYPDWQKSLEWDGPTVIMPGYKALISHFTNEFKGDPKHPLFLLYVGDGGGRDFHMFEQAVTSNPLVYVAAAIVGDDRDAQAALNDFRGLESRNPRVRAFDFTSASSDEIVSGLLAMIG